MALNDIAGVNQSLDSIKKAVVAIESWLGMSAVLREGSAFDAGLSGDDQIRIALLRIRSLDVAAEMRDIYAAVESEVNKRGWTLSFNGRAALRSFVNRKAVLHGYILPYDIGNPGWRITSAGRRFISRQSRDS